MRIRSLNHSTYSHLYHIVWGTKYRRKYLKPYVVNELNAVLRDIVKKFPTLHIEALNTDEDHVHLQIEIPPDVSVAVVVQKIKATSSKQFQKKFKFIREMYLDGNIWSVGYFSSTNGLNDAIVKRYIEKQGKSDYSKQARFGFE